MPGAIICVVWWVHNEVDFLYNQVQVMFCSVPYLCASMANIYRNLVVCSCRNNTGNKQPNYVSPQYRAWKPLMLPRHWIKSYDTVGLERLVTWCSSFPLWTLRKWKSLSLVYKAEHRAVGILNLTSNLSRMINVGPVFRLLLVPWLPWTTLLLTTTRSVLMPKMVKTMTSSRTQMRP